MPFILECRDKPDSVALRQATRPAHLAYLESQLPVIIVAGPIMSDDGQTPVGSLLVLDLPDAAAVRTLADNDPYAKAGLFESVTIRPWRQVFPRV